MSPQESDHGLLSGQPKIVSAPARCAVTSRPFGMRIRVLPQGSAEVIGVFKVLEASLPKSPKVETTAKSDEGGSGQLRGLNKFGETAPGGEGAGLPGSGGDWDGLNIKGTFSLSPSYPGCPGCQAVAFFKCGPCARLACWDGKAQKVTCPWCGHEDSLSEEITSIDARPDQ